MSNSSILRIALFGPQRNQWTAESLADLQSALLTDTRLSFLKHTLDTLPSVWPSFKTKFGSKDGISRLENLQNIAAGVPGIEASSFTNAELAPLTVISQVVDLIQKQGTTVNNFEAAQGFCIGFLTATSFASAWDWEGFEDNISRAVRLAACVGMIVDAEQALAPVVALSVRCKTTADRAYLDTCLDRFPDAYISCITDEKNLTISLPEGSKEAFSSLISEVGIASTAIGLRGRYHHQKHFDAVVELGNICRSDAAFQLPQSQKLRLPLRSTASGEVISTGALHDIAIGLILRQRAHWFQTVKKAIGDHQPDRTRLVCFGAEACIPRSLITRGSGHTANVENDEKHEEVAVVGMSCRFPRSENLEEFWQLLYDGETAIGEIPQDRFDPAQLRREPKLPTFWGNFLDEPDIFDHKFFGISGREAKSMDPQQRLALQVAYEALASSGYLSGSPSTVTKDVGCYLGVGAVDYEDNIASKDANAFSALGVLRAFISGRISHHFGFEGPSLTLDTACSSSAVAIHTACKAILSGECAMAIAGGVNVITSPSLHQNLAGASFLNPNGSSKAFDANAGGYCRGEGAGMIILKPLSKALADGDRVIGIIASSAVNQGSNCSPITVPHSYSQSNLYKRVLENAGIKPQDVTYVEAHGTGTQVGDPIEYESVRCAFCSPLRTQQLFIGSVKDNIGHAEAASGVAGVIKTLLMMQHKTIPKQANFSTLNGKIKTSPNDRISVPKRTIPWKTQNQIALVNNYGAAGSNAALLIRSHKETDFASSHAESSSSSYPLLLSAKTATSLTSYTRALTKSLSKDTATCLGDFAYNLAQTRDVSLDHRIGFVAPSLEDTKAALEFGGEATRTATNKPVVLCFGGQAGRTATISKELYDNCDLLKKHMDACDSVCKSLGLPSIFPGIFQCDPIEDTVLLHCRLLSLQVSCAKTWIESGLEVETLMGHSFGQLAALCVADSLSLEDTFRLVAGRARLIRDNWGPERGAMLAVECDKVELDHVQEQVNSIDGLRLEVACYNGPRSFVLAGDGASIVKAAEACKTFKVTELQNTHAYHSYLADGILEDLAKLTGTLDIKSPRIRVETCSADRTWAQVTTDLLVQHTRQPVYFSDAVTRVAQRLPTAIWVEAGSATPIIPMIRRALGSKSTRSDVFLAAQLGAWDARANLAKIACELWKAGSASQYWLFHQSSGYRYRKLNLPPYQFEKTSHWISLEQRFVTAEESDKASEFIKLVKDGRSSGEYELLVDTSSEFFQLAARGHAVTGQSLCPASMYMEMVARSASLVSGHGSDAKHWLPHIENLTMMSPLGIGKDIVVVVRLSKVGSKSCDFTISSQTSVSSPADGATTTHATGRFTSQRADDVAVQRRFSLLGRLGGSRSLTMAAGVSGTMVYKLFSDVVDYADYYRGVHSISASDNEAVGKVKLPVACPVSLNAGICDPIVLDNFLQVSGIHSNCLSYRDKDTVLMCTSVDEVIFSSAFLTDRSETREWVVYTRFETDFPTKSRTNDIFVRDAKSGDLVLTFLGANFKSVPFKSLSRSLARLNKTAAHKTMIRAPPSDDAEVAQDSGYSTDPLSDAEDVKKQPPPQLDMSKLKKLAAARSSTDDSSSSDALIKVRAMFSEIIEIPMEEVTPTALLEDLGIDSLLVTEVLSEIKTRFGMRVDLDKFSDCKNVGEVAVLVGGTQKKPEVIVQENLAAPAAVTAIAAPVTQPEVVIDEANNLAIAARDLFAKTMPSYDNHADNTGFTKFYAEVFPTQSELVVQYVVTAFAKLGCDIQNLSPGEELPAITNTLPEHKRVMAQLHQVLATAGLITKNVDGVYQRTEIAVGAVSSSVLLKELLEKFPKHASETKLLHSTAQVLAECLTGEVEPIPILFGNADARALMGDVYTNAPMFKTGTLQLTEYLSSVVNGISGKRELKILELGAGTGGTTKHVIEALASLNVKFTYTFTDISSSLVAAARRKFSKWTFMEYKVTDIEKEPKPESLSAYDIILSTNCIHATKDLVNSTTHIRQMLKPDGLLCLVELTRNLYWFDLVFGLLEGWWLFTDGREHALATPELWKRNLNQAGFRWVDWSRSSTEESELLRVITASPYDLPAHSETLPFKETDGETLHADIYYPSERIELGKRLPVALMIHGGGHVMLSRKDIRPEQTEILLQSGFLPISIDYRLCPEVTLSGGPMEDAADALHWVRNVLAGLKLARSDISIDASKVVAVGWSTGGHIATSLAWTCAARGIQPPEAILALYCPLDYEDPFWMQPNLPEGAAATGDGYNLDDNIWTNGIFDAPITKYNVAPNKKAMGGWLATSDPRSRLALYMNSHGRALHVLLNGLNKETREEPPEPTTSDIVAVSPLAQVRAGNYKTPTFIIHPRDDDLIPWQQAERTWQALRDAQVDAELRIVEGVPHLFDLMSLKSRRNKIAGRAVMEGYDFLCRHVGLSLHAN